MDNELLAVNVMLSGRSYRIRIHPDEEASVRRAVKEADDKIRELRAMYSGKDDQDFLAMCLLMYATDGAGKTVTTPLADEAIDRVIARIDQALAKD